MKLLLIRVSLETYGGRAQLGRALGMTPQNVHAFVKRWAPDGIEAAIADLWPDDSPPVFLPEMKNPGRTIVL